MVEAVGCTLPPHLLLLHGMRRGFYQGMIWKIIMLIVFPPLTIVIDLTLISGEYLRHVALLIARSLSSWDTRTAHTLLV